MSAPNPERLLALLGRGPVAVLTGAGLSTESGIPAYRDRDGQWQHAPPIRHREFLTSEATRRRYWARSLAGWPAIAGARPNRGHFAIASLESCGIVSAVITQNVDGLHQAAGSTSAIDLHGGLHRVCCLSCPAVFLRSQVQDWLTAANPDSVRIPPHAARMAPDGDAHGADGAYASFSVPDCPRCGGMLKPDVVFFGDSVPRERVRAAQQAVTDAAALLVVGSSLMVYSGYRLAEQAHRLGKPVIAINRGVTRADPLLALKIDEECGAVLAGLVADLAAVQAEPERPGAAPGKVWYVYLVECLGGSYYTGVTTDVERRFAEHLRGEGGRYTRSHPPVRVLASRAVGTRGEALKAELAIKRLPREKKLAAVTQAAVTKAAGAGTDALSNG